MRQVGFYLDESQRDSNHEKKFYLFLLLKMEGAH